MSVAIKTDVLVVGLGPAGACAALAAASAGLAVVAIERNAVPGEPVQCAEFIPMMMGADTPATRAARIQEISRMLTYVEAEAPDLTPDFRGYMVDRAAFDRLLIAEAAGAGADCRFSTPLREIRPDGTAIIGDGLQVRARIIIGADGPRSPVGNAIGHPNTELVETRQITVDLLDPHDGTDIFLNREIEGGYAWLFPRGRTCNLGLGVLPGRKARLKPLLEALHGELAGKGRVGTAVHRHTGGLIPVGGIVGTSGRIGDAVILLAGDAAGLTNPVTGAGINAAVLSGRMAGEAAAAFLAGDAEAVATYDEDIRDLFGPSLSQALKRRRELMEKYRSAPAPDAGDLRKGWVAYPQYWTRENPLRQHSAANRIMEQARENA